MRKVYYKTVYNPEFSVADRENYFSAILPQWLNYLDVLAPSRQGVEVSCQHVYYLCKIK